MPQNEIRLTVRGRDSRGPSRVVCQSLAEPGNFVISQPDQPIEQLHPFAKRSFEVAFQAMEAELHAIEGLWGSQTSLFRGDFITRTERG